MPRIGYASKSADYSAPGDRRRFCFYARKRGIAYEQADPSKTYDLVVVTEGADLSKWVRYDGGPIVFDFVNSYLVERGLRKVLRGLAKFSVRQNRLLHLDYVGLLKEVCRRSNAVICTTRKQKEDILPLCGNVHIILDIQSTAVRTKKTDYAAGNVFNLVWEGLPGNVATFEVVADALRTVQQKHEIALHFVTDIERPAALNRVGRLPTKRLVRRVLPGIDHVYLYEWNEELFSTICTACDLAIVPIPLDKPMFAGKPENKLVLFWRMGLPVITSATPAYSDAMQGAGLSMTCRTTNDWIAMLDRYIADEGRRRHAGRVGQAHAENHYSEEKLLEKWDNVFDGIGVSTSQESFGHRSESTTPGHS